MPKIKTIYPRAAATWRRFLAAVIDVLIFFGAIIGLTNYVLPIIDSCGGMFCGIGYLIEAVPLVAITATFINIALRRSVGDMIVGISYIKESGTTESRGWIFGWQICKYVFLGLFAFSITFAEDIARTIGTSLYEQPVYVTTQKIVDDQNIYKSYYVPKNARIVPESEYIKEDEKYHKQNNEFWHKISTIETSISILFSIIFGYIYFIPLRKTGTPIFLYLMNIYPVKEANSLRKP